MVGKACLSIVSVERRFVTGNVEAMDFNPGVNLVVGAPNTGKTKWLQTLDYLLGDTGENPFGSSEEDELASKYEAAAATLQIGDERVRIERRWREAGSKGKVFIDGAAILAKEFQQWLLERLGIPFLHFPKGNPMSGMTWPELSFRMLLRHIHRQQRFWSGLADQQPEGEQFACIAQFLGVAEKLFTPAYGELIALKIEAQKLEARHDQFGATLQEIAADILNDEDSTVGLTRATLEEALARIATEVAKLESEKSEKLRSTKLARSDGDRERIERLTAQRALVVIELQKVREGIEGAESRHAEVVAYSKNLAEERGRLERALDAGDILSDLRVTHCPACDQAVSNKRAEPHHCFLCSQSLPDGPAFQELGSARIEFEKERLGSELKEADQLVSVLSAELKGLRKSERNLLENLSKLEEEIAPARQDIGGLAYEQIGSIDRALGRAAERGRQLHRIETSLIVGEGMADKVKEIRKKIAPLQVLVDREAGEADLESASSALEEAMNRYLGRLNELRPKTWRHSSVRVDLTTSSIRFKVGSRRWDLVLGGTDTLYFLMSYHYGLLSLSDKAFAHYPGLSIIDVPGEFSGEAIEDKENFIVQPFIELLALPEYSNAQLIMTGASFVGLSGARFLKQTQVYVAS